MDTQIKLLRKKLGLTQQEFANRLNIKRGTIANYEIGRNEPIDAVISLICKEFNVNEEWFRTGKGEMFIEIDPENKLMEWAGTVLSETDESFRKRFVKMLMELDEQDWVTLEKMALKLYNKKD
ncbi:helix-turn-helix transcriptional regulator [Anaerovorax odorimutans]|uniref:Helix-turn-helix transcriptional regulator n=1 Tax=Anaerovorax odorimutans TaxID=109327 RepID=A0ABT1RPQ0_9FIRM|nr:helix-turn-helix transcriptional regulator [Anaerovorax odorimutans]MCQ4637172.1 helix-turn-helix transcriptional regulator [Anaerovorax odorimutans]